ncbi:MAG: response regulator, partial [Lachnospiraceae bacterium]|nr:response regulator [Lachnospiraceae bacterium]
MPHDELKKSEIAVCVVSIIILGIWVTWIGVSGYDHIEAVNTSAASRIDPVLSTVRRAMFPLLCAVLIIIASVILEALDILRIVLRRRNRGLVIIALFGIDAIFYSFIRTDIFTLFVGNKEFFRTLEEVSYILMPLFLVGFFFRGFKMHFPKHMRVLFYTVLGVTVAEIVTYPFWGELHTGMFYINIIIKIVIILILAVMLKLWKDMRPQSRSILMDETALACLAISILANPSQEPIPGFEWLETVKMVSTTAYFIFMMAQHIQIMLAENRYRIEQRARELEEQNNELTIARNEAEEAKTEAIAANEAKSRFLANMSHEIRTPINAVLGMDEMILRESRDKSIREYAIDIRSAGRTLLSLINDILDFSKIESGKMEIVPVEYDFAPMITDLINMLQTRAAAKDLELVIEVDPNIPTRMFGDDVRIKQCFTNILTNAVKYTPSGTVWLRAKGYREGDDYLLTCEVEDTGIGIKEEDLPKLFKEYERIEESRNRNIEGTGLGMNITLQLLSLMDSKLEVSSVYGKGSTFWFEVRQHIVDDTPVGDVERQRSEAAEDFDYSESFIAPEAKVLVVDDNAMNRKVFMSLLKATRIQVDDADGGPRAIELAGQVHYDVIFMDHMMPDMDGIEAMKAIKAMPEGSPNSDTPIYVLTANAVTGAKDMYMAEGFDGYLSKPVVADKLENVLREKLPKELMLPAPEGEGMGGDSGGANPVPEDLPSVDGLDWNFAWLHLPEREMLEDSVRQYYELIKVHAGKLQGFFEGLPDEDALDNYRIQVHGMKSSAATIGIVPLAGMAKVLEYAAK